VPFDADPVPEPVRELRVAAREAALDHLRARGAVDVAAEGAGADRFEGRELRVAHRVPRALDLDRRRAVEDPRPRVVALVPEEIAACVDEDDGPALETALGVAVGSAAAGRGATVPAPAEAELPVRSTIAETRASVMPGSRQRRRRESLL
jgi:hypothetical protein